MKQKRLATKKPWKEWHKQIIRERQEKKLPLAFGFLSFSPIFLLLFSSPPTSIFTPSLFARPKLFHTGVGVTKPLSQALFNKKFSALLCRMFFSVNRLYNVTASDHEAQEINILMLFACVSDLKGVEEHLVVKLHELRVRTDPLRQAQKNDVVNTKQWNEHQGRLGHASTGNE